MGVSLSVVDMLHLFIHRIMEQPCEVGIFTTELEQQQQKTSVFPWWQCVGPVLRQHVRLEVNIHTD